MTKREKKLSIIFLVLVLVCLTLVNAWDSLDRRAMVSSYAERYALTRTLLEKSLADNAGKRVYLDSLQERERALSSAAQSVRDPYLLGRQCRVLLEQAGATIRSFSLGGTAADPLLETSLLADRTVLPQLFLLLDSSEPRLRVTYCSLNSSAAHGLDLVMRIVYADSH